MFVSPVKFTAFTKLAVRLSLATAYASSRSSLPVDGLFCWVGGNSAGGFVRVMGHSAAGTKSVYMYGCIVSEGSVLVPPGASSLSRVDIEKRTRPVALWPPTTNHDGVFPCICRVLPLI